MLSNPTNVVREDATATATITDDDNPPVLLIDPAAIEFDEGSVVTSGKDVVKPPPPAVRRSPSPTPPGPTPPPSPPTPLPTRTTPPPDPPRCTFKPGETQKRIRVEVVGDQLDEGPEIFLGDLGSPTNACLAAPPAPGVATINDDDALPTDSITGPEPVDEPVSSSGETDAVFIVSLSVESGLAVMVEFATADGGEGAPTRLHAPARHYTLDQRRRPHRCEIAGTRSP